MSLIEDIGLQQNKKKVFMLDFKSFRLSIICIKILIMSESSFEIKQECPCSSEEMYEKPKKQMAYECGKSQGPWSLEEHQKYIIFMEHNVNDKKRKMHKKTSKLFKLMSKFIDTRNLLQCRSHHQKLELKYRSIRIMIQKQKKKFSTEAYNNLYEKSLSLINQIYQIQFGGKQPFFSNAIKEDSTKKPSSPGETQNNIQFLIPSQENTNPISLILLPSLPLLQQPNGPYIIFPQLNLNDNPLLHQFNL